MNRQYFNYLHKSKKNLNILLLVINLIFPTLFYFVSEIDASGVMASALVLVFVEAVALPIVHFNFINSKSGVDTYYALPVSRKEIYITTMIYIVGEILITHFISILPILLIDGAYLFELFGFIKFLLMDVISIIATVCIASAIFMKAYSTLDGVVIVLGYLFTPILLFISYCTLIENTAYGAVVPFNYITYFFYPYMYILAMTSCFEDVYASMMTNSYFISMLLVILIGAIGFGSIMSDSKKRKAEYAGAISNNFFSYPLIISLLTIAICFLVVFSDLEYQFKFILLSLLFIAYLVINSVYRRHIEVRIKNFILFLAALGIAISINTIAIKTEGFGLREAYMQMDDIKDIYFGIDLYEELGDDDRNSLTINLDYNAYDFRSGEFKVPSDALVNKLHELQSRYLELYNKYLVDACDGFERRFENNISVRMHAHYDMVEYSYPSYKVNFEINDYIMREFYDLESADGIEKMLSDVYTMIENGCHLGGEYYTIENGESVIYEIKTFEDFKECLERYFR